MDRSDEIFAPVYCLSISSIVVVLVRAVGIAEGPLSRVLFCFVLLRSYVPFCRLLLVCPSCIARVIIKRSIAHDLGQRVEGETHLIANDRHLPSLPNHCTLARQTHPLSGLCGSAASPAPPPRCRRCGGRVAAAASLVAFESS